MDEVFCRWADFVALTIFVILRKIFLLAVLLTAIMRNYDWRKRKAMLFSRFSMFSNLLFSSLRHGLIGMVVNFSIGAIYASHGNIDYHLSPNAKRVTQ